MASRSLRCVLIGSDSLLVQCGEILLREGHDVRCVVTDTPRVATWARERGLATLDPSDDYVAELSQHEFECLFSITWLKILPREVLALPTEWAINFHDGPLPAYAGLYTPAWAILNREPRYGVTWHCMTEGVDEGDLLEQESFELQPDETSLTLNTRCFEAGLESFERLVRGLGDGTVRRSPQPTSGRSYFGKFDRPAAACAVDWNATAEDLEALVRALDFGRYPNPLGTPKVGVAGEVFTLSRATATDSADAGSAPGTVLAIADDGLLVATGAGALRCEAFARACGSPLTPRELARAASLEVGARFEVQSTQEREALTGLNRDLARSEAFWVGRLTNLEPLELPWARPRRPRSDRRHASRAFAIPAEFASRDAGADFADTLTCALGAYLSRVGGKDDFHVSFRDLSLTHSASDFGAWIAPAVPLRFALDGTWTFAEALKSTRDELDSVRRRRTWLRDAVARTPALAAHPEWTRGPGLPIELHQGEARPGEPATHEISAALTFHVGVRERALTVTWDEDVFPTAAIEAMERQLATFLESLRTKGSAPLGEHALLDEAERERVLSTWNRTETEFDRAACVHHLFEEQARRTPDAVAGAFGDDVITFAELDERAGRLATYLRENGVGRDDLVGVHVERSIDLLVCVFGVLKAGGAYLPLDPAFPADRIAFMVEDSRARVILTQGSLASELSGCSAKLVQVDRDRAAIDACEPAARRSDDRPDQLAYAIYTSGSTGKPKGVLVEHRNVVNFFAGMDQRIAHDPAGTWLAVTSLSFDISVLELLWTACRGFKTVLYGGVRRGAHEPALDFGLSFFASNAGEGAATQYELLFDAARFADRHGFRSVWTPERHFHAFGGLYPNPSVTSAALAAITENVELRAGSVVVALHDPIRIAEEWSLVDNLSRGRVGISIASGWHPNDFVLAPQNYEDRKQKMLDHTDVVRRLWRGEAVSFSGPRGDVDTRIMPKPVQAELPVWITAAGNPETFRQAGREGTNVLTHLLGQSLDELRDKIRVYREAWREAGHAGDGKVTIMLHTFIGEDVDDVRETVRGPMREYLRSAVDLIKNHVSSWSAVKKSVEGGEAPQIGSLEELDADDVEALLDYSFERYFETSALFGTPESCMAILRELHELSIDEVTCLIDFGVPSRKVLMSLPLLNELKERANRELGGTRQEADESIAELIARHGVTHLQCTPSMATMLVEDDETRAALERLEVMLVGGEALPVELARKLCATVSGTVLNMYGPTETTIWSSVADVKAPLDAVTIGTPIANTQLYVLDANLQPVPAGVLGELYIAGDGVTRGYHDRPELTAERFLANPFRAGERMYRTGDLARWLESGEMEFVGRADHQVKVRGYRIELGEIETRLSDHAGIAQAVVVTEDAGNADVRLIAWCIAAEDEPPATELSAHLLTELPEYMVPSEFRFVREYPLTPNKKIDRKALASGAARRSESPAVPAPAATRPSAAPSPTPATDVDESGALEAIQRIWCTVLGVERVGPDENFFDLGGHSLLTIRVQKALREELSVSVPLVDMFRFTTVRALARRVAGEDESRDEAKGPSRAAQRAARRRRRAS